MKARGWLLLLASACACGGDSDTPPVSPQAPEAAQAWPGVAAVEPELDAGEETTERSVEAAETIRPSPTTTTLSVDTGLDAGSEAPVDAAVLDGDAAPDGWLDIATHNCASLQPDRYLDGCGVGDAGDGGDSAEPGDGGDSAELGDGGDAGDGDAAIIAIAPSLIGLVKAKLDACGVLRPGFFVPPRVDDARGRCIASCMLNVPCADLQHYLCQQAAPKMYACQMDCETLDKDAYFACGDGQEVWLGLKCDGLFDCVNYADEDGCGDHACADGTVVPAPARCDFWPACTDGSDEQGCALICPE